MKIFCKLNWFQFLYYNFLCRRITRDSHCYLLPYRGAMIELDKTAHIFLHGTISINTYKFRGSRLEAFLRLRAGAILEINGNVQLYWGAVVEVHRNATLTMGRISVINIGVMIICAYRMLIGDGVLFAPYTVVMDSDFHHILNDEGEKTNPPLEVNIGDNVWLCAKSTVLRGANIPSGTIVPACALVTRRTPASSFITARWEH